MHQTQAKAVPLPANDIHHRSADQPSTVARASAKTMRHSARQQRAKEAADQVPSPYSLQRIAKELDLTAAGEAYYGNALRVAKDVPGVSGEDRLLLDRYATGRQRDPDHVALQELAIKLRTLG